MSDSERRPALDQYIEVKPLLRHVRIMRRFFDEVIDGSPEYRKHYPELHVAYMKILNEELAAHALTLALAIVQLEEVCPAISDET